MEDKDSQGAPSAKPSGAADVDKLVLAAAAEVLVAITDEADQMVDRSIDEVLRLLRQLISLDLVFFSRFAPHEQVLRNVVGAPGQTPVVATGQSVSYDQSWCKRAIEGEIPSLIPDVSNFPGRADLPSLPFPIATYMTTPVLLGDGSVYGTLCGFSAEPTTLDEDREYKVLKAIATLLSSHIQRPVH